jgi:glycosyltransferase involved in cell wall biosynthesis
MKILYICSADLSGEAGSLGSVRHILEVCENLSQLGNRIKLIAPNFSHYPHSTSIGITYVPLINIRFLRTIIYELLAPVFIAAYLVFWRPDIIYWRQAYLTLFPVLLCRVFGKIIVTEVNGLTIDEVDSEPLSVIRKKVILKLETFNYRHSNFLICVAPKIKERILKHYHIPSNKVSVILNGVNSDRMPVIDKAKAKKKIGIDPELKVIGFVGHFFPWDGIEYLIDAAVDIVKKEKNVRFLIIGHGRWGNDLPLLVKQKNLTEYFIFTGKVPWKKLYIYINAFDIATAPYSKKINSQSGRSSLKILEYFACKKPVVASETAVIPEVVDLADKNLGITVPSENSHALAEAIFNLLKDKNLRQKIGKNGREYVVKERSWKRVAINTQKVLASLVHS